MTSHSPNPQESINLSILLDAALYVTNDVIRTILFDIRDDPEVMLGKVKIGRKQALRIDANAEDYFRRQLHKTERGRFAQIIVHGEERLNDDRDLNLTGQPGIYALVDMVDGTDLLERGLYNWCSAIVFFCPCAPEGERILAAFVGIPSGESGSEIYYATATEDGAYVKPPGRGQSIPVSGPSSVTKLQDASVCFYGQKAASLQSILEHRLLNHVVQLDKEQKRKQQEKKALGKEPGPDEEDIAFRIYTLAGIPMMVKLADHRTKAARNIDVVFDVRGQQPHDVVAGAFIAKKGGAVLKDLNGKIIEYADLEKRLLKPKDKNSALTYVLASTEELCNETVELVRREANRMT